MLCVKCAQCTYAVLAAIWQTKHMNTFDDRENLIATTLRELAIYLIFLATTCISELVHCVHAHTLHSRVRHDKCVDVLFYGNHAETIHRHYYAQIFRFYDDFR
jgi:hypothetical protein